MASPASSATATTTSISKYTANEKRRRIRYEYSDATSFYRTSFPGHRPRYLPVSGINDGQHLYQKFANLWPEYFSVSAPCAFSWSETGDKVNPIKVKGLIGVVFYHPSIKGLVNVPPERHSFDLIELESVIRYKTKDHVEEMAKKHRISASGEMILDFILVREGRDEVKVRGNARAVSRMGAVLQPKVIGGMECKKCLKRKRARGEENVEERPAQRRQI